ncbi:MAG: hypothetical protein O3C57_07555 [Verrucomicrobia bacterium]|nr:hypothetical protein [Verrucomicrobiota bacterium]
MDRNVVASAMFIVSAAVMSLCILALQLGWISAFPGCAAGSACDRVLLSAWSDWARKPLAGLGLMVFGGLSLACVLAGRVRRVTSAVLAAPALTILFVSAWLIGLQYKALGALCAPCLVTLAFGSVGSAILVVS